MKSQTIISKLKVLNISRPNRALESLFPRVFYSSYINFSSEKYESESEKNQGVL